MDGQMEGWVDLKYKWMNEGVVGQMDKQMERWLNGWVDGWMEVQLLPLA